MSVSYDLQGAVAVITVDDGRANALGHEALAGIDDALTRAESEASAAVIAGRPGKFSAGFDLATMTAGEEPMRALVVAGAELLCRVMLSPVPVVAACTGHALAAGGLLLLVCDRRIGAEGAFKVGLNEVAIGMPLPKFGVDLARYRCPPSLFDRVILGEVRSPEDAVAAGFLDEVVAEDAVIARALAVATEMSALRRGAVARTKAAARGVLAEDIRATVRADMASISGPGPD